MTNKVNTNSQLINKLDEIISGLNTDVKMIKDNMRMRESIIVMLDKKKGELENNFKKTKMVDRKNVFFGYTKEEQKELNDVQKLINELRHENDVNRIDIQNYDKKLTDINTKRNKI